ncbi:hypothetical protein [Prochlorococcus sp. MIT 1341]|uniref:hypothetical protein n=1 Tax=Prochlorococcus sp. MIT 1341 TaxID=3096221 RepID=UPI002A760EE2|nr:hypothetical protein [Prochlorococcus sp. MIT 1341]
MKTSFSISDTLIGSLCREVDSIRYRIKQLLDSIQVSRDAELTSRLMNELHALIRRKREVNKSAQTWLKSEKYDQYSIEFLLEVSSRNSI